MNEYFGVAKEQGITDDEIGAVQSIVMAVAAGKVRAQFREVRSRLNSDTDDKQDGKKVLVEEGTREDRRGAAYAILEEIADNMK